MTNAGVSALSHGCSQLFDIDLTGCRLVTIAGISALDALNQEIEIRYDGNF